MKNTFKIKKSQLTKLIAESVKETLEESSPFVDIAENLWPGIDIDQARSLLSKKMRGIQAGNNKEYSFTPEEINKLLRLKNKYPDEISMMLNLKRGSLDI